MTMGGLPTERASLGDRLFALALIFLSAECGALTGSSMQDAGAADVEVASVPVDLDRELEDLAAHYADAGLGEETEDELDDQPRAAAEAVPVAQPGELLSFLPWVAAHCYVDALGPSAYTLAWRRYTLAPEDLDPGAVMPAPRSETLPVPGSKAAEARAAALRADWLANPRSHVVDCRFYVPLRPCRLCVQELRVHTAHYIAYLPAALSRDPESVRTLLMIVPGGRGGRSRPFLSPVPDKTHFHAGSGGLQTKQRVDAYLAEHPETPPPIVVALETNGDDYNNGRIEHLSSDMPTHVANTFLGGVPLEDLLIGAEGISSGARAILDTLLAKPNTFATAGLTCLSCGMLNPRKASAREQIDFEGFAAKLGERAQATALRMRFSIGSRDGQLACNQALYDLFTEHGVFDGGGAVRYTNCRQGHEGESSQCDNEREGWVSYVGEMHHYGLLKKSYPPQLEWHLSALTEVAAARRGGRR
jgi:hypothetical protein